MESFLASDFSAAKIANGLVRSTSTAADTTVDFGPARTRLGYDIDSVNKELTALAAKHPTELLDHAGALVSAQEASQSLGPSRENVARAYEKLEKDFMLPYARAQAVVRAATKLQHTASLARALAWYLHLASQVSAGDVADVTPELLLQAAQAYASLDHLRQESSSLLSLAAVRAHEPTLAPTRNRLVAAGTNTIREFVAPATGSAAPGVSGDRNRLKSGLLTLHILDADVVNAIDNLVKVQIGAAVLQLSRSASQSPASFVAAVNDARSRANALLVIDSVAKATDVHVSSGPLEKQFWADVGKNLDQKLRTASVANPAAWKSMQANKKSISEATQDVQDLKKVFEKHLTIH